MKVFDLECALQHVFEGWFASEDDFLQQQVDRLIGCPVCGALEVSKRLSAPRLNLGAQPPRTLQDSVKASEVTANGNEHLANLLSAVRHVLANTENVGAHFAAEARNIHYGDAPHRSIRGTATVAEAVALFEEGIAVIPMDLPDSFKTSLH